MDGIRTSLRSAAELLRAAVADRWTRRTATGLLILDFAYIGAVAAKALGLVWFVPGAGNILIAAQLGFAAMVVLAGYWRFRDAAFATLVVVTSVVAVDKIVKLHNVVGERLVRPLLPDLGEAEVRMIGMLSFVAALAVTLGLVLLAGWRRSATAGRGALVVLSAAAAFVAGTALAADLAGVVLPLVLSAGQGVLSRFEQGLELLAASTFLTAAVGVVRARERPRMGGVAADAA